MFLIIWNLIRSLYACLIDFEFMMSILIFISSCLGCFWINFWYAFQLVYLIFEIELLQNVMKAFVEPW